MASPRADVHVSEGVMASLRTDVTAIAVALVCAAAIACERERPADPANRTEPPRTADDAALQRADPALFAACDTAQRLVDSATSRNVTRTNGTFTGAATGVTRTGCHIAAVDTLQPDVAQRPLEIVWQNLVARGWSLDQAYVADAPDGSMLGLRSASILCVLQHYWQTGSDDERVTRPETPFRYDIIVECFRAAATRPDSSAAPAMTEARDSATTR